MGKDDDRSGEVTLPRYIEVDSETKRRRAQGSAITQCTEVAPDFTMCSVTDPMQNSVLGNSSNASLSVAQMSQTSAVSDQFSKSTLSGQSLTSQSISIYKRFNQQDLNTISETRGVNEPLPVIDDCINLCGYQDAGVTSSRGGFSDTRQSISSESISIVSCEQEHLRCVK